jgi:SSS family transporter
VPAAGFTALDWWIVLAYFAIVAAIGAAASRRGATDLLLGGRRMPMWAVALSVFATATSAATFIGGPQQSYAGNLTYFSANVGALLAVIAVAVIFVPAFYRHGVTSVYELLRHELGGPAAYAASGAFLAGRLFASGARLFMAALPFSLVAYGDASPTSLALSTAMIAAVTGAYTIAGGIRAIIWTDVAQALILIGTAALALAVLWGRIPADAATVATALRESSAGNKLTIVDLDLDLAKPYTFLAVLVGMTLLNAAAFGTDQDLAQRILTCRSARSGAWSLILSNLVTWPALAIFLVLGLLLHVFYERPDIMGAAAPAAAAAHDSRQVFLRFILEELPPGVRGLAMSGLLAAAMGSLGSAIGAMASATIVDFYRPWRRRRDPDAAPNDARDRRASRIATAAWSVLLAGFACVCIFWQQASGQTLIDFALGVMVYAYGGLLGVFVTAILTRRGNAATAVAAIAAGFAVTAAMEVAIARDLMPVLAFPWRMTIATAVSFAICAAGRRPRLPRRLAERNVSS